MRNVVADWRERLRAHPAYEYWRRHRERQFVNAAATLVDEGAGAGPVYSEIATRAALEKRARYRRPLAGNLRVGVFGTSDWEQRGLWPALERAGSIGLFDYGSTARRIARPTSTDRRALGRAFLDVLDEWDSVAPVTAVFAYAAGCWLDPAMLKELASRGIWTVLMGLDDKQQIPGPRVGDMEGWQLEAAQNVDLYWTTWRAGADWLAARGVQPWFAPEAADPAFFAPRTATRDIDVLWVGRGYGRRRELVQYLRARGLRVQAYGPGWQSGPVSFETMLELYARSKVILGMGGVGPTEEIKHLKGRDFEVPMAGGLYLTSFNPELTDAYVIGSEILCYSSFPECADTVRWILRRPDLAEAIRRAARARCVAEHTWDHRVRAFLNLLGVKL